MLLHMTQDSSKISELYWFRHGNCMRYSSANSTRTCNLCIWVIAALVSELLLFSCLHCLDVLEMSLYLIVNLRILVEVLLHHKRRKSTWLSGRRTCRWWTLLSFALQPIPWIVLLTESCWTNDYLLLVFYIGVIIYDLHESLSIVDLPLVEKSRAELADALTKICRPLIFLILIVITRSSRHSLLFYFLLRDLSLNNTTICCIVMICIQAIIIISCRVAFWRFKAGSLLIGWPLIIIVAGLLKQEIPLLLSEQLDRVIHLLLQLGCCILIIRRACLSFMRVFNLTRVDVLIITIIFKVIILTDPICSHLDLDRKLLSQLLYGWISRLQHSDELVNSERHDQALERLATQSEDNLFSK